MEEEISASASDAFELDLSPEVFPVNRSPTRRSAYAPLRDRPPASIHSLAAFAVLLLILTAAKPSVGEDAPRAVGLERVRQAGKLLYGSDMEGGGPYAYPDPKSERGVTGFEVELMTLLGKELGISTAYSQGQWDKLLQVLGTRRIDLVINGYEWTQAHGRDYLATRPYYVYQLQLMTQRGGRIRSWSDLKHEKPGGGRWKVGVLVSSAADTFATEDGGPQVEVVRFDGATDAMLAVQNGQFDATLQDLPAALFYHRRFPGLALAGAPESRGYYVIYVRKEDETLRDALDTGLARLIESGELRRLYEKYGIWNEAQQELSTFTAPLELPTEEASAQGWSLIYQYRARLIDAALMTLVLSITSMPLAMALGLLIAVMRLYGPRALQRLLAGYVELIRGTPLMLQLFVLFYVLPRIGLTLDPLVAGIAGLAINYSAYEAEIYRAGLQAVPAGQMEAALALGMSRTMALRRVIIPQATRIVIPPVTNDFIALFKDTSVCSVITLTELTKQYSMLAQSTGGVLEFALAVAALYMMMSLPLSWFSRWTERRLAAGGVKGGALT
jgi:polar amino acid transport system permease protein/polar amino acid transport system substrate-binding protein